MRILLTGSTGYIGRRLLPELLHDGHEVICVVRDRRRFDFEDFTEEELSAVSVIEGDFLDQSSLEDLPKDIDAAYYLIHSLTANSEDFKRMEKESASNFSHYIAQTDAKQIIYLGGIANDEELSEHLSSRRQVEEILTDSGKPVTVLRSAIIIGSGGASFEILRDLVEKLPVMVAPKWLLSKCQPIAVSNVLDYLKGVLLHPETYDQVFDIGGKDILSYKQMLLDFAKVRGLKRWILIVPVLTLRLSSLWLVLVTSTSYRLARNLVDSMKNEVICRDDRIDDIITVDKLGYVESLERTFQTIDKKQIVSSWKDSFISPRFNSVFQNRKKVPEYGCLIDKRTFQLEGDSDIVLSNIWEIGGERGWYYGNFLWSVRGIFDKFVGGVGLRRGRRSPTDLKAGDALDFWRVLDADKTKRRLLLFAEMKVPGDAWLEFRIRSTEKGDVLVQTATFRPLGLAGRTYWYMMLPFHAFIFKNMAKNLISYRPAMELAV